MAVAQLEGVCRAEVAGNVVQAVYTAFLVEGIVASLQKKDYENE
jgi:hypothetical protein